MPPIRYDGVDMSAAELEAEQRLYGGLADSVRALADASLRTTVPADTVEEVTEEIGKLTARLAADQVADSLGVSLTTSGTVRAHGNAVVGLRNPVAPPLQVQRSGEGRAWAEFRLGALYEGPPGLVHGGVAALVLDQICGEAAADGGSPGMTGTLTLRYERGTPLGECSAEAWIDRVEGVKTFVTGELRDTEGRSTVRAEGVFILPRWAREAMEQREERPPRFE